MSLAQKEALLNEYKGNVFEFLVAQKLANTFHFEQDFWQRHNVSLHERLVFYGDYIRENDPELYEALPKLTQSLVDELLRLFDSPLKSLSMVGKLSGPIERDTWGECDLLLSFFNFQRKLSLKLCKENAFVNTKSAGLKSFIEKYFSSFSSSFFLQKKLNEKVEKDFYKMGHSLYEQIGLEFFGKFDEQWQQSGQSELPGELDEQLSLIVLNYYSEQASFLRDVLLRFYQENSSLFLDSLFPLIGMSDPESLQAICYHGMNKGSRYHFKGNLITNYECWKKEIEEVDFLPCQNNKSSFEIKFKKMILQIRCKPMNKFTVPALKINCSVKRDY